MVRGDRIKHAAREIIVSAYANIWLTIDDEGFHYVTCQVEATTADEARACGLGVLGSMAGGKEAYIRAPYEASYEKDFDTKITKFGGYVRFGWRDQPGEWHYPEKIDDTYLYVRSP